MFLPVVPNYLTAKSNISLRLNQVLSVFLRLIWLLRHQKDDVDDATYFGTFIESDILEMGSTVEAVIVRVKLFYRSPSPQPAPAVWRVQPAPRL